MKRIIRLGDPTDHGGKVVSASSTTTMFGKPVALVGDAVTCPQQGHVNCTIVEGDPSWTVGGKGVALEGHKVSCGATLISTMGEVGRSYEGSGAASAGAAAASSNAAGAAVAAAAAALANLFNDKYQLLDQHQRPLAGHAYAIERESGEIEHGVTDDDGHTHLLADVARAENIKIYAE
ncbi:PAAR domain-containing protein [Chromobacterium subtsugae]|uniref:PAAR domain-containing protein n=1 Tax=Chromobacterium subtsugae TaxID=251747 RepID=UPI0009B9A039|nr:PAAR domain-containing protein [Chromobacterium subtsugae]